MINILIKIICIQPMNIFKTYSHFKYVFTNRIYYKYIQYLNKYSHNKYLYNLHNHHINELNAYSKSELKEFSKYCDLKTTGTKSTLSERLIKYFEESLEDYDYFITVYGLDMLIKNIGLANNIGLFEHYIHSELMELRTENQSDKLTDVLEEFYKKHYEHAKKLKDIKYYM